VGRRLQFRGRRVTRLRLRMRLVRPRFPWRLSSLGLWRLL